MLEPLDRQKLDMVNFLPIRPWRLADDDTES